MDALIVKFLREMSLGVLYLALAAAVLLAIPLFYAYRYARILLTKMKGDENDRFYCR